jgi:hypothetical protein
VAKDDTAYVGANGAGRIKGFKLLEGEMRLLNVDYNAYLGNKSTSLNATTWVADNTGVLSVADATISSGVASAEVTGSAEGVTTVKVTTTLASGEILIRKFHVRVIDPTSGNDSAYQ